MEAKRPDSHSIPSPDLLAVGMRVWLQEPDNKIHYGLQSGVIVRSGSDRAISACQVDFRLDIFDILKENHTPLIGQVAIHRPGLAAEDAIDRNAERGCFPIHRAAAADHKIGIPDNVQSIDHVFRDEYSSLGNQLGPELLDPGALPGISRQHDHLRVWLFGEVFHHRMKQFVALRVMVVRFICRRPDGHNQIRFQNA